MRKQMTLLLSAVMLYSTSACNKSPSSNPANIKPIITNNFTSSFVAAGYKTRFTTNFDANTTMVINKCGGGCPTTDKFDGTDWTTPGDQLLFGGKSLIEYQGGSTTDRQATISTADGTANTSVLNFRITNAVIPDGTRFKGRVQHQLFDYIDPDGFSLKQFYQKVSIMLNYDSFHAVEQSDALTTSQTGKFDFLTLFEEFNGVASANVGDKSYTDAAHRVTVGLIKDPNNSQRFIAQANSQQWDSTIGTSGAWSNNVSNATLFNYKLTNVRIIPGVWYTFEIYILEGGGGNTNHSQGAFWLKVTNESTPTVVGEVGSKTPSALNPTQSTADNSGDGFHVIFPMKFYASNGVIDASKNITLNPKQVPSQIYFDNYTLGNIAP